MSERPKSERPDSERPRRHGLRIAVFIAIITVIWVVTGDDDPPPPVEPTFVCEAPLGEVDALGAFRWSFDLPDGGSYELRIYDDVYTLLGAFPDLAEPSLELDPEVAARLPERIAWEVFARDAAGADVGSCRAEAWRR